MACGGLLSKVCLLYTSKQRGEKISMLTSYDYTMAQIVDGAGVDVILVGDSASNVMAGNVTTCLLYTSLMWKGLLRQNALYCGSVLTSQFLTIRYYEDKIGRAHV